MRGHRTRIAGALIALLTVLRFAHWGAPILGDDVKFTIDIEAGQK